MDSFAGGKPPVETPEQRRERLLAIAKERVRALIAQPQVMGGNQGSGVDRGVYTGPRGGRFTRVDTKDGRPYRRYF